MKLSIMIPSLDSRQEQLNALRESLVPQMYGNDVEILVVSDSGQQPIGDKRNQLLKLASGEYCCSIDDDDRVADNYIELLMQGINKGVDCCSLVGSYNVKGRVSKTFKHSIQYNGWYEKDGILYRYPNHLNCIRTSIAKQMIYPSVNDGEDKSFSQQLQASGLLKTEHIIEQVIYQYDYIPKVR